MARRRYGPTERPAATHQPTLFSEVARRRYAALPSDARTRYIFDLFCGAGGSSSGAVRAIERRGERAHLGAINHDPLSVASHEENHPYAAHYCHPIDGITPAAVVPWGYLDLLLVSPSCKPFSTNVSGRELDVEERALCWHVLPWISTVRTEYLLLENVPGFAKLGPLHPAGHPLQHRPIPEQQGAEFEAFLQALRAKGYDVDWRILDCADYGVAQQRTRLFLRARFGAELPEWPEPTHGSPDSGLKPWLTARDILDFSLRGKPITHPSKKKRLGDWTLERIEQGLSEFGGEPFLVPRKQGNNSYVRSVDRPMMTIVASKPGIALIQKVGGRVYHRQLTIAEYLRACSFDESYILHGRREDKERMIGNAVPPLMAERLVDSLLYIQPQAGLRVA